MSFAWRIRRYQEHEALTDHWVRPIPQNSAFTTQDKTRSTSPLHVLRFSPYDKRGCPCIKKGYSMERRTFVQSSLAVLGTAAVAASAEAAEDKPTEVYELRVYTLPAEKQNQFDQFMSEAFIPASHRCGISAVGAFLEPAEKGAHKVYVLIVHPGADSVLNLTTKLAADENFRKAGSAFWDAKATDAAYTRFESSILKPIAGMPRLAKPDSSQPRLLNLRVYESPSERAALKKIEMFNEGELAIFRRVGLTPVFFGSAVAGTVLPNLTYMLVFPNEEGRAGAWKQFIADAEWKKLKAIPEYADKDIVSRITNRILTPTKYSEI